MQHSDLRTRTMKQLELDEGRRSQLYRDHLGYLTIGIGRMLDTRLGGRLRESEIDFLFSNDFDECRSDLERVFPWFSSLGAPRQAALINMRFQLGLPKLMKFTNSLGSIRDMKWEDAAFHLKQSEWARQTPERARRVIEQIRSGEWQY